MRYRTVSIKPHMDGDFHVTVTSDDLDRVELETQPSHFGFFHYPETMPDEKAFQALKQYMIDYRRTIINNMEKDIRDIQSLQLPEKFDQDFSRKQGPLCQPKKSSIKP